MTVRTVRVLLALLLALAAAACGSPVEGADEPPAPSAAAPVVAPALPPTPTTSEPTPALASVGRFAIDIASIGASSSLVPLGLNPDRTIATPSVSNPGQAGWYEHSPLPGDPGPAVILGHINGGGRPGVFSRLAQLREGDRVTVTRDGAPVSFTVYRIEEVAKTAFPTARVYGDTAGPELRLLTCGGALDRSAHHYLGQTIVYAALSR